MHIAETRQGLDLIRPNHQHGWLGDERYSNRRGGILLTAGHPSNPTIDTAAAAADVVIAGA